MPFKSQAQRRWMYANKPEMAKQWEDETTSWSFASTFKLSLYI